MLFWESIKLNWVVCLIGRARVGQDDNVKRATENVEQRVALIGDDFLVSCAHLRDAQLCRSAFERRSTADTRGKLPAILEIVRSMDRFDRSFHRFSLWLSLACPATRWVVLTSLTYWWYWLQHAGFCEHRQSRAVLNVEEKSSTDKQSDSIGNQTVEIGVGTYVFGFRSHAFGVVSDHALVSFLFQRTHTKKKAEKEKPIDADLADSTGLMEKLWKRRAGLRKVYGKTTCTILFVDLPSSNMRSPCGYCDNGENTWRWGVRFFFISCSKLATHRQP